MDAHHNTQERLTALEIKASFTEVLIDQLDQIIVRQQQQIDQLVQELTRLRQQVHDGGGAGPRNPRDELPPHY